MLNIHTMTHFVLLVIIPYHVFIKGNQAIQQYIDDVMRQYDENLEVDQYVEKTKEMLEIEFENYKQSIGSSVNLKYDNAEEYAKKYCGYELDDNGNVVSTYNQKCIFDWYVVGGRWDGILTGDRQYSNNGFNFGDKHHTFHNNMIKVGDLLEKYKNDNKQYLFGMIFDKNGVLHEGERYGWWGTSQETKETKKWESEYETILNDAKSDYCINLDCHI